MPAFFITFAVGVLCIVIAVSIYKGNISLIHSYHTHRVSEEDKPKFAKEMGRGMFVIGVGITLFSVLAVLSLLTENSNLIWVATALEILSLIVGITLCFRATIKYNKGLF